MTELQSHRVGYALAPKKEQSFVVESFIDYAKQRGIDLIRIEPSKPLIEQGPFDCVIHKLYDEEWKKQLGEFSAENPNVVIVDPLEMIEKIHNRASMLDVFTQLKIPLKNESFGVPKQVLVEESEVLNSTNAAEELNLKFPLIAKPLLANGSLKSHEMCLVFDSEGLKSLSVPIVLQEFVNHGGVVFKVYVAGQHLSCVKRNSLPDISEEKLRTLGGTLLFSQISSFTVQENGNEEEDNSDISNIKKAEMPPMSFITDLSKALVEAMGLHLFNIDLIRDGNDRNKYYVIDINYFPGYEKIPSFETLFIDFLWDIVHENKIQVGES
ncbi:Inositol-tetrakisphosphate 1-kinase 1 [Quillaja saponaria]|uniref:Inositol-tetrakisphosphate 1-kinase n=1 Tax=Quillaja saponaria TaxID=32244 RepID=A0AAD7KU35_QUISA|nr:Inositol-tetrakisphosphate 1-kinase 1 [Quillaja saponaria]